jgi:hypothetical protein
LALVLLSARPKSHDELELVALSLRTLTRLEQAAAVEMEFVAYSY